MKTSTMILWIVVVLIIIAGGWYWYSSMNANSTATVPATPTDTPLATATETPAMESPSPSASPVAAAAVVAVGTDAKLGSLLTAPNGMTLYMFTKDKAGVSNCTGACATTWPPYTVAAGTSLTAPTGAAGTLTTIARADGTMQVAYNGKPLYYYVKDTKAGDTLGQGVGGVWFVVKP